ncbi:reticulon-like protein B17 [Papaver somniferum]|uniref:reticulon-like protein B17 n=1 Tax=Papaver somniferum TaxID=3469 RepID=UPI000E6F5713|nr:reticulon-like protein B17 [Papaver somniferum]
MDPSSSPPPTIPSSPKPEETQLITNGEDHPHLSLGILNIAASSPRKRTKTPLKPPYSIKTPSSESSNPLQEIILLSPSPRRKSQAKLIERMETVEEPIDLIGPRKRCKNKASPVANQQNCASPRVRRSRRRLDQENRDDKEVGVLVLDEIVKPRKRKPNTRPRKEKASAAVPSNSLSSSPRTVSDGQSSLDNIKQLINDLVMWRDVAKSSLWFGFGSLCFLSSCTSQGLRYSVFSGISHLGLLFLAFSFLCNSCSPRYSNEQRLNLELKEDDIVRIARKVLPVANFVIVKTRELFSGEPSMTLKVAPILLFGAEYGHLITLWRLCAIGFFISFTAPKLYASYSMQIEGKAEYLGGWILGAWKACSLKKIVAVSAALAFWNLSSIKTRVFSAFLGMVILRYRRQHSESKINGEEGNGQQEEMMQVEEEEMMQVEEEEKEEEEKQGKALMVIEKEGTKI